MNNLKVGLQSLFNAVTLLNDILRKTVNAVPVYQVQKRISVPDLGTNTDNKYP